MTSTDKIFFSVIGLDLLSHLILWIFVKDGDNYHLFVNVFLLIGVLGSVATYNFLVKNDN